MKWPEEYRRRNMHFWCMNFGGRHDSHTAHHVMLGGEEDDAVVATNNKAEQFETEERRLRQQHDCYYEEQDDSAERSNTTNTSADGQMRNTSFNHGVTTPSGGGGGGGGSHHQHHHGSHQLHDSETGGDLRVLTSRDDGHDFRIGNTVLSPYCCVGLIIFALLFILIGSVLTFAITRHWDDDMLRFLDKHNYLRAVSPLMICSGIIMLLLGITFWVVRRCRSRRRPSGTAIASESYFPPEGLAPQRCLPDTLLRGGARNSMGSAISSRAVSPLLPPSSAGGGRLDNVEWKWPTQQSAAAPPLGSFPRHSSNESSPVHSVLDVDERMLELQHSSTPVTPVTAAHNNTTTTTTTSSTDPCDLTATPDVKVIPVGSSSSNNGANSTAASGNATSFAPADIITPINTTAAATNVTNS